MIVQEAMDSVLDGAGCLVVVGLLLLSIGISACMLVMLWR